MLKLRWQRRPDISTKAQPLVTVGVVRLQAQMVSGSGDIVGAPFKLAKLRVRVVGSGDVKLKGRVADDLTVEIKG